MKIIIWWEFVYGADGNKEIDIKKEFGITDEEWKEMEEDERIKLVEDWIDGRIIYGYEKIE